MTGMKDKTIAAEEEQRRHPRTQSRAEGWLHWHTPE